MRSERIDLTPKWPAMVNELLTILGVDTHQCEGTHGWALGQLQRIGEHLESLPDGHKLPMVPCGEFFQAKREVLAEC